MQQQPSVRVPAAEQEQGVRLLYLRLRQQWLRGNAQLRHVLRTVALRLALLQVTGYFQITTKSVGQLGARSQPVLPAVEARYTRTWFAQERAV
jgi:hypothetical protein